MQFKTLSVPLAGALVLGAASPAALACSTCKCGDYSITLFGVEKPYDNRLRVGLDLLWREEAQGEPGVAERQTQEWRSTLGLAYSVNERLTLAAQLPWVAKTIEDSNLARQEADGIGDVDLIARWTAWQSADAGGRHRAGLRLGVRLPTAEEIEDGNGQLLDIDVQPDAGATAPNAGAWYGYYRFPWLVSASATGFWYGDGNQGFQPGDSAVVSVHTQYAINQSWALQLGLDARNADNNRFSGASDPDSGGFLAMAWTGAAVRLSPDLVLQAGVQTPLIDDLNGQQDEQPALRLSVAYDF